MGESFWLSEEKLQLAEGHITIDSREKYKITCTTESKNYTDGKITKTAFHVSHHHTNKFVGELTNESVFSLKEPFSIKVVGKDIKIAGTKDTNFYVRKISSYSGWQIYSSCSETISFKNVIKGL